MRPTAGTLSLVLTFALCTPARAELGEFFERQRAALSRLSERQDPFWKSVIELQRKLERRIQAPGIHVLPFRDRPAEALEMAKLARIVYAREKATMLAALAQLGYTAVEERAPAAPGRFLGTYGFTAVKAGGDPAVPIGSTVVVFRGTTEALDWQRNFAYAPRAWPTASGELVHGGFLNGTGIFDDRIERLRRSLATRRVYVTGHSLGGALAELFACKLVDGSPAPGGRPRLFTFGAPRAGTAAYVERFHGLVDSWAFARGVDPGPHVPLLAMPTPRGAALFRHLHEHGGRATTNWFTYMPTRPQLPTKKDELEPYASHRILGYIGQLQGFEVPDDDVLATLRGGKRDFDETWQTIAEYLRMLRKQEVVDALRKRVREATEESAIPGGPSSRERPLSIEDVTGRVHAR